MPYMTLNGMRLYYEEEGTGPPLVLLSGAASALDSVVRGGWATLRPYLAQRYQVVQFDQRGHGRTDNPGGGDAYTRCRPGGRRSGVPRAIGARAGSRRWLE